MLHQLMSESLLKLGFALVVVPGMLPRLDLLLGIVILNIAKVPGSDNQVFVPIEVDVHKHGCPRPVGGRDSGVECNLGEGAVVAVQEEGITHDLWPVISCPNGA